MQAVKRRNHGKVGVMFRRNLLNHTQPLDPSFHETSRICDLLCPFLIQLQHMLCNMNEGLLAIISLPQVLASQKIIPHNLGTRKFLATWTTHDIPSSLSSCWPSHYGPPLPWRLMFMEISSRKDPTLASTEE